MHPPGGPPPKISLPNIKHLVAVASGKGGVGKSTVATNLALALHMLGRRVGLMDADIYGPSIPIMMGLHVEPATPDPVERYGLKLMSMGFVLGAGPGRGPARADGPQVPDRVSRPRSTGASSITWSSTCRPAPATPS